MKSLCPLPCLAGLTGLTVLGCGHGDASTSGAPAAEVTGPTTAAATNLLPSVDTIQKLIRASRLKAPPVDPVKNGGYWSSTWCDDVPNVQSVQVLRVGDFNQKESYWPLETRIRGTCIVKQWGNGNLPDLVLPFDGVADFHLKKDDYGTWTAERASMHWRRGPSLRDAGKLNGRERGRM